MLLKRLFTDKLGYAFVHYSLQPSYKTLQMIENYIYTGKKSLIVYARKGVSVHLERRGPETIEYSQDVYVERSWFKPVASEDRKTNRNINVMLLLVNLACHVYVWYVCNRLIFRRFTSTYFVVLLKGHDHGGWGGGGSPILLLNSSGTVFLLFKLSWGMLHAYA